MGFARLGLESCQQIGRKMVRSMCFYWAREASIARARKCWQQMLSSTQTLEITYTTAGIADGMTLSIFRDLLVMGGTQAT
jgi:hypothetical protein